MGDLRVACRTLIRQPGMTTLAIIAIALGIGLTTTMFGIVNGTLLRGLPFPDSHEIVTVGLYRSAQQRSADIHGDVFRYVSERQQSFSDLAAFATVPANVVGPEGIVDRYSAARITWNMFPLLRTAPTVGRNFLQEEDRPGAEPAVIVSHRIWREQLGSAADAVGRTLRVNGTTMTVVGVMPEGFRFPNVQDLWLPLALSADAKPGTGPLLKTIGRLKPAASKPDARAELSAIAQQLAGEQPERFNGHTLMTKSYAEDYFGTGTIGMLYTMFTAALGVLLIASVNVANLMLGRTVNRTHEMSVRAAVGAGRWRIVRQILTEVFVLAAAGAVLGIGLAHIGLTLFNRGMSLSVAMPYWMDVRMDFFVLAFVTLVTLSAALVAGIVPAVRASRTDVVAVANQQGRVIVNRWVSRVGRGLVVVETALACAISVSSGLVTTAIVRASNVDFGFAQSDVWTARVVLPAENYANEDKRRETFDRILSGLAAIPGVVSASLSSDIPMGGTLAPHAAIRVEGGQYATDAEYPSVHTMAVSPNVFDTLRVPIVEGRGFDTRDRRDAQPVVVINQSLARTYFPQGAIGRRLASARGARSEWRTVIGVVPDLGVGRLPGDAIREAIYLPADQSPPAAVRLFARTSGPPLNMTSAARRAVSDVDPELPIFLVGTLESTLLDNTWPIRLFGMVFVPFGAVGLLLAAVGLYGVVSYWVNQRVQEIGVRMALGARVGQVLRMVLWQGLAPIALGAAIGIGLALPLGRSLEFMLFGVDPGDVRTIAGMVSVLVVTGLVACLVPSVRAARVDPMKALRHQ